MLKRYTRILFGIIGVSILVVTVTDWRDVLDWPSERAAFWLLEIPARVACLYAAVRGRWVGAGRPVASA